MLASVVIALGRGVVRGGLANSLGLPSRTRSIRARRSKMLGRRKRGLTVSLCPNCAPTIGHIFRKRGLSRVQRRTNARHMYALSSFVVGVARRLPI